MQVTDDSVTLKRTHVSHCQVCARPFETLYLVYFVPIDNNIVCASCARESGTDVEPRIYINEEEEEHHG